MKIIGTLETITTPATAAVDAVSVIEETVVEADGYAQGLAAIERNLPEGTRLIGIRVER
jgi:thiamine biosynthesis lipoprotein ApbE